MTIPVIDPAARRPMPGPWIDRSIAGILDEDLCISGPKITEIERVEFRKAKRRLASTSGTYALHLAPMVPEIKTRRLRLILGLGRSGPGRRHFLEVKWP